MQTGLRKTERELKIKNYSPETLKSYLYGFSKYYILKIIALMSLIKEIFETSHFIVEKQVFQLAVGEGFEPPVPLPRQLFSRQSR